ncbi:[Fe-Fe] hydrogenase large subunit C-terminal domain-containing protein [Candidatus Zixiibacteriota bacterium]
MTPIESISTPPRSLRIVPERCDGRMGCLRVCPTEAIRIRKGKARILVDRCIGCGECITVCTNGAIVPLTDSFTDFSKFDSVIAIPSPVLYGQFSRDILPSSILEGLKRIGFDDVADVARACESVSMAMEEFWAEYDGPKPVISAFCPTVVRLVQVRFTDLSGLLLPIESPMEIAAREAKRKKSKELGIDQSRIGAIYVTPCPAKMVAIRRHPRKKRSYLDGAISIADIYGPLLSAMSDIEPARKDQEMEKLGGVGLGWPILGGVTATHESKSCLAVSGLSEVIRIFEEIENGKLRDLEVIECRTCPAGCIGGSLTVDNPYVVRSKIIKLLEIFGAEPRQDKAQIKKLYREKYFSLEEGLILRPVRPLDEDVSRAIQLMKQKQKIYDSLPKIDCGACGSPNCMAFAEDMVRGEVEITDCILKLLEERGSSSEGPDEV